MLDSFSVNYAGKMLVPVSTRVKNGVNEALNRKSDNKRDLFLYTLKLHKKYEKHDRIHISY